MEAAHIIAFNLALLAAMASPGPALLLALKTTLTSGRLAGIATGLGLGTMAALWTAMALLGLEALFALFPWAYLTLKLAGAAYLLYIAYGMWKDARTPLPQAATEAPALGRAFARGFMVNIGNPKSVIFAASVLVVIFPQDMSLAAKAAIALNHLLIEGAVYTLLAVSFSTPHARAGYLSLKPLIDRAAALILGALGLRLILTK